MGILVQQTIDQLRGQLPAEINDRWTDEELDSTAYFLAVSGLVPAGVLGAADVDAITIGVTSNFIASALLAPYLTHEVIDPKVIGRFIGLVRDGTISADQFLAKA